MRTQNYFVQQEAAARMMLEARVSAEEFALEHLSQGHRYETFTTVEGGCAIVCDCGDEYRGPEGASSVRVQRPPVVVLAGGPMDGQERAIPVAESEAFPPELRFPMLRPKMPDLTMDVLPAIDDPMEVESVDLLYVQMDGEPGCPIVYVFVEEENPHEPWASPTIQNEGDFGPRVIAEIPAQLRPAFDPSVWARNGVRFSAQMSAVQAAAIRASGTIGEFSVSWTGGSTA